MRAVSRRPRPGVPLREYFERLLAEMDLRYQQRFADAKEGVTTALIAAEKAVNKAEVAAEKRFEGVNEFRGQLSDQAATFLTRTEYDAQHQALAEKISDIASRLDRIEGTKTGGRELYGYLVAGAVLVVAVITLIVR